MTRKEALRIGEIIADKWYRNYGPTIKARQNIERQKNWRCQTCIFGQQRRSNI